MHKCTCVFPEEVLCTCTHLQAYLHEHFICSKFSLVPHSLNSSVHELARLELRWDSGQVQVWDGLLPNNLVNVSVTREFAESFGANIRLSPTVRRQTRDLFHDLSLVQRKGHGPKTFLLQQRNQIRCRLLLHLRLPRGRPPSCELRPEIRRGARPLRVDEPLH